MPVREVQSELLRQGALLRPELAAAVSDLPAASTGAP